MSDPNDPPPPSRHSHYTGPQAPDFMDETEPFALFERWFANAREHEPNDPEAMALATVDRAGMPNVRMVLLKALDGAGYTSRGFVFYTNFESAKGSELLAARTAALAFHWKSLRRQVRVRGLVSETTREEADAYFASRARGSRIGAWASQQSRPMAGRYDLEKAAAWYGVRHAMGEIPRPDYWSGFRVTPLEIEFWHDRPFRLHDRVVFRRADIATPWQRAWLFP